MTTTASRDLDQIAAPPAQGSAPEAKPGLSPQVKRVRALARFATTITIFNILGHAFLGFEQAPITPIVAALTSYATALLFEWVDAWAQKREPAFAGGFKSMVIFLLPAHITGLACGMLLWGNTSLWPYMFAIAVGNGAKYVVRLRVNGKLHHVLNPSNTGIAVVLVLFPWVSIAPPYHFTNFTVNTLDWLLPLGILMFGSMLNAKLTGKMPLILGWLGAFALQAVLRWLLLDHSLLGALVPMTGLAFILFTNYMITDPGSSPSRPRNQVIFGVTAAAIYSALVLSGITFGLFFALVITCVLRGFVLLLAPRFKRPEPVVGAS
ncbi:enediyne biosynthesis protein UnbU [Saccharothrix lopnurensis]|uniref:Enediyne biosynthesis protein UnbU n=1 Tax=Saccharothrix lopnurensis TaxID=1670621 RepID=A0ABW1P467_9PSEU